MSESPKPPSATTLSAPQPPSPTSVTPLMTNTTAGDAPVASDKAAAAQAKEQQAGAGIKSPSPSKPCGILLHKSQFSIDTAANEAAAAAAAGAPSSGTTSEIGEPHQQHVGHHYRIASPDGGAVSSSTTDYSTHGTGHESEASTAGGSVSTAPSSAYGSPELRPTTTTSASSNVAAKVTDSLATLTLAGTGTSPSSGTNSPDPNAAAAAVLSGGATHIAIPVPCEKGERHCTFAPLPKVESERPSGASSRRTSFVEKIGATAAARHQQRPHFHDGGLPGSKDDEPFTLDLSGDGVSPLGSGASSPAGPHNRSGHTSPLRPASPHLGSVKQGSARGGGSPFFAHFFENNSNSINTSVAPSSGAISPRDESGAASPALLSGGAAPTGLAALAAATPAFAGSVESSDDGGAGSDASVSQQRRARSSGRAGSMERGSSGGVGGRCRPFIASVVRTRSRSAEGGGQEDVIELEPDVEDPDEEDEIAEEQQQQQRKRKSSRDASLAPIPTPVHDEGFGGDDHDDGYDDDDEESDEEEQDGENARRENDDEDDDDEDEDDDEEDDVDEEEERMAQEEALRKTSRGGAIEKVRWHDHRREMHDELLAQQAKIPPVTASATPAPPSPSVQG